MELARHHRKAPVHQPLDGAVVGVPEPYGHIRRKRLFIHLEAVILTGHLHLAGPFVPDGMIAAVMAELHLPRPASEREGDHLMPEADTENRNDADEISDGCHHRRERGRIAGAVREEHPVGGGRQDVLRRRGPWKHRDCRAPRPEFAKDIPFHTAVDNGETRVITERSGKRRSRAHRGEKIRPSIEGSRRNDDATERMSSTLSASPLTERQ